MTSFSLTMNDHCRETKMNHVEEKSDCETKTRDNPIKSLDGKVAKEKCEFEGSSNFMKRFHSGHNTG